MIFILSDIIDIWANCHKELLKKHRKFHHIYYLSLSDWFHTSRTREMEKWREIFIDEIDVKKKINRST